MQSTVPVFLSEGKAILPFTGERQRRGIASGMEKIRQGDIVWFGDYGDYENGNGVGDNTSVPWKVLDAERTSAGESGMFLLAGSLIGRGDNGGLQFGSIARYSSRWKGSDAQRWCSSFFDGNLSQGEQGAVLSTSVKKDEDYVSWSSENIYSDCGLEHEKLFFLSAREAEKAAYGLEKDQARVALYNDRADFWWLRSSCPAAANYVGVIHRDGYMGRKNVLSAVAARPAFNLNPEAVFFVSAAKGSKDPYVGADCLEKIGTGGDNREWKLTLKDGSLDGISAAVVDGGAAEKKKGYRNWRLPLVFSGGRKGKDSFVSVLLCSGRGEILYRGRLAQDREETEEPLYLRIPSGLGEGEYSLYLFNERRCGNYRTDYAGRPVRLTLKISRPGEKKRQISRRAEVRQERTVAVKRKPFLFRAASFLFTLATAFLTGFKIYGKWRRFSKGGT